MDKVVHFEIPADDLERAQKFYKRLFGWEIVKTPAHTEYYLVTTVETDKTGMPKSAGAINGGLIRKTGPIQQPSIVIKVQDIKKKLEELQENNCKIILPATKVGDFGLHARFLDCEDNVIGLWQDVK